MESKSQADKAEKCKIIGKNKGEMPKKGGKSMIIEERVFQINGHELILRNAK